MYWLGIYSGLENHARKIYDLEMKLTRYTDYALRVLMHLAVQPRQLTSISTIARAYGISQNHLVKVVQDLRVAGFVEAARGRTGGIRLARPPEAIVLGEVVRHTEEGFDLVNCGSCLIAPACALTGALHHALGAFMDVLDGYSIADLTNTRAEALRRLLAIPGAEAA
jgi:Rrf2 family nitric oxide-sensitive transcriptional repressor